MPKLKPYLYQIEADLTFDEGWNTKKDESLQESTDTFNKTYKNITD